MGLLYFSSLSIIALKRKLRKIFVVSYNVVRMYEKVLSQFLIADYMIPVQTFEMYKKMDRKII